MKNYQAIADLCQLPSAEDDAKQTERDREYFVRRLDPDRQKKQPLMTEVDAEAARADLAYHELLLESYHTDAREIRAKQQVSMQLAEGGEVSPGITRRLRAWSAGAEAAIAKEEAIIAALTKRLAAWNAGADEREEQAAVAAQRANVDQVISRWDQVISRFGGSDPQGA
jgi:hypothetical protein